MKSLAPSSMERQSVSLALKIFNYENVNGLRFLSKLEDNPDYLDTALYIEKMTMWFDVMNVKTPDKGLNLHNPLLKPVCDKDHPLFAYLREFSEFLMLQRQMKSNILTNQTFKAISTTTRGMLSVLSSMIDFGHSGILSGNFQTDPLEKRFGIYRATLWSNYHVNDKGLSQAEKKLRLSSLLDISKSLNSLRESLDEFCEYRVSEIDSFENREEFRREIYNFSSQIFLRDNIYNVKATNLSVVYYITGWCVKKYFRANSKLDLCCKSKFISNTPDSAYNDFVENMGNKEYLCYPTKYIYHKIFEVDFILNSICQSKMAGNFYNKIKHKDKFVIELLKTQIQYENTECNSSHKLEKIVNKIVKYYCNIFFTKIGGR